MDNHEIPVFQVARTPEWRVPDIVRAILAQAVSFYRDGEIPEETFFAQLRRLESEELEPRGLELQARRLTNGDIRFIIRNVSTRMVCDLIECAAA